MTPHLNTYQNTLNLPQELKVNPSALVGCSGLDTLNNAIHKSIWESFNNRAERAPIEYKMISNTHKFPVIKPKRNSYDWYIPKGILKRNWLGKYLHEVPAIIVIFFDLDWNDSSWNEKMIECASKVQSMRAALEGRDTKIIVVLIQNNLPIPEDPLAADRAIALCSSCELNAQSLYVLPHGQHLLGYTIRLENAFFEICQTYYFSCVKNIKAHKEFLNKNSHQFLYVRHQFKMAFLNELKQDLHAAHKYYTLAYNNLLEIRIVDTNALEIRTVAGFINYKICKLLFSLSLPRDAISQFKGHIDKFKSRIGFPELIFEHHAWLSKQHEIFADIFDEAVKQGLPAVQTQHPGIYYQQAAQFAILRKDACHKLCSEILAYPYPDPLEGMDRMEFYGQRPWRPGKVSAEPPDPSTEANGIQALQFLENQIGHSSIIINLYGMAIAQYKIYKCPRTRRHLVLQMAEECYNGKDFGKALTLFTHMLSDYRDEKWWTIISSVLDKALKCAFLTANIQDYLQLALEILGSNVAVALEDKRRIYENFNRILKKQIPFGDPKLPHDILQNAIILWQPVCKGDSASFTLDMSKIPCCVEVKWKLSKACFEIDHKVSVEIYVRSTCPFPLTFWRMFVKVTTPHSNKEYPVNTDNFAFHFNEVKRFDVEFEPDSADLNHEIVVDNVNITIGSPTLSTTLTYSNQPTQLPEMLHFKSQFDNLKIQSKALLVPRESKLSVKFDHAPPALVGECYEISIIIENKESSKVADLRVEVGVEEGEVQLSHLPEMASQKLPVILPIASLDVNAKVTSSLFFRAKKADICNLTVKITYQVNCVKPVISFKQETIVLPVVEPFEVSTKFLSTMMQTVQKFYVGEEFKVLPLVQFLSPWPVVVEETTLELVPPLQPINQGCCNKMAGNTYQKQEIGSDLFVAVCLKPSDQNLVIGDYRIKWKRQNGTSTTTQITLHGHHCDWVPLNLTVDAPAFGFVRTPMVIAYHLINQSSHLVQLDVGMEASESFMFSGYRQTTVSIMPHSTKTMQYNLYPLVAGSMLLPRLTLSIPENSIAPALRLDQLSQLVERTIPYYIYVMPQLKGTPSMPDLGPMKISA